VNECCRDQRFNEVKIWFQGATGSGKSLLSGLIRKVLEERGVKVRGYVFGSSRARVEDKIVDLRRQDISDVLTVELDRWEELEKLLDLREREIA
jgi:hypothetical protein